MKRMLFVLMIIFPLYACTIKADIPFLPVDGGGSYSEKLPVRASFILKSESEQYSRPDDNNSGVTIIYVLPSGRIINSVAREVLPEFFQQADFVSSMSEVHDGVVITTDLVEYRPSIDVGFSDGRYRAELSLKTAMHSDKGHEIFSTTAFSDAQPRGYNAFSGASSHKAWGEQTYDAFRNALVKGLNNMLHSYAVVEHISEFVQKPKTKPEKINNTQSKPQTEMTDREKLRYAFENGDISSDQLSRAIVDLTSGNPSKILQSFLSGSVDTKTFSDLY